MKKNKIESKRKKMIDTALKYGINSQKALHHSQELDKLLCLYQKNNHPFKPRKNP